jgi:FAD/FMN-containing dehydrogenase
MVELEALRTRITGPVLGPLDPGFEEEVAAWSLNYTHTPDTAVGATSSRDVAEAVAFARDNDLPVRIQSTGHGSHEAVTDGILILTRRLDQLSIDPATCLATIGAGVQWGAVVAAAAPYGLAPIPGSSPTVGAVGYLLGGGVGPLARSHGFSSDYVRDFEVVTAAGETVHANESEHPDLFWALRGGKGGLGVVTQVTVRLVELADLYGGSLVFDAPNIDTALRAWVDYTATADPDVTTSVAIVRAPDLPFVPEPLRGRTVLSIRFAYPGSAADGERLAAALRGAAPVYLDMLGELPAANIADIHNDPTAPSASIAHGGMIERVDQELATVILDHAGAAATPPYAVVEVRHLGSRASTDVPEGSAVGGRTSEFTVNILGIPNPGAPARVISEAVGVLVGALTPWLAHVTTVNFVSNVPTAVHAPSWSPEQRERLAAVRGRYDPEGVFPFSR